MPASLGDTIVALSSGRLPAGIAVIRISGSKSRFAIETICGSVPLGRLAKFTGMRSPDGQLLDSGLVLFFEGPNSFTGEDCGEFHVHGGKAVVASVLETLTAIPDIRHAEAGEFTRRAFLNGKLDLVKSEALADLISAETEAQRRFAVLNAEGAQADLYQGWRRRLIHARAMIEAEMDFSDEADVPGSISDSVWQDVALLSNTIRDHIEGFRKAEIIRDGYDVVIIGAPNAGKSSLLNALARRDAAIVSDEPGTTRDLVELSLDINGLKIRLTDTAGIREGAGKVESIGIGRAKARAENADLVLHLVDLRTPDHEVLVNANNALRISTKADLLSSEQLAAAEKRGFLPVSSKTGLGLDALLDDIGDRASAAASYGDILPSRLRHVELLRETRAFLEDALAASAAGQEIQAEYLRQAADRLGRISGAVDVEDLLDVIFSQFCIGK